MPNFDTSFDFTRDTPGFCDNFWLNRGGLGRGGADPDSKSKTLQLYHRALWSRRLPNGQIMELQIGRRGGSYCLQWENFIFASDLLVNGYRWLRLKSLISDLERAIPNYKLATESYVRKTYTIGGMLIFPRRRWSINQSRACNPKILDRMDLTFECIRRFYANQDSPLFSVLERDRAFFDLFVDFKGFVDFFFLQDIVSDDYGAVNIFFGSGDFSENPLPKNLGQWLAWRDKSADFIDRRNARIAQFVGARKGRGG